MAITLARPVCNYEPTPFPAHLVAGLPVEHVPTELREHTCAMLIGLPSPSPWLDMGEWFPTVAPRTLLARRSALGMVQYGTPMPPVTHTAR